MANPTPDATPAAPERELVHPLELLRGIIRRYVAYDVALFVLLFLSLWFWLGVAFDYGLFKLLGLDIAQQITPLFRVGVTGVLVLVLVVLLVRRTRSLLTQELSLPSLALVLEKRYPKVLGDRLITAIEMADVERASQQGYSEALVRNTIAEARERISQVDVHGVFNWGRLWRKGLALVGIFAVGLVAAAAAYLITARSFDATRFAHQMADVSAIWGERNLLIWNTPWPRRAFVRIVDFDDEGHPNELRVGKGAAIPPKVSARVYKWVVADRKDPDGWRPLAVADLIKRCKIAPPERVTKLDGVAADTTIDDLELRHGQDPDVQALLAQLDAWADDPWNSRTVRKLVVPNELTMKYEAMQSKARMSLTLNRDASGTYSNDVAGLGESVRFSVTAEDFVTARRQITLVPPPTLIDLYRDEYQPAYLHHAAPILSDEQRAELAKQNPLVAKDALFALRNVRQAFTGKKISISSDKSMFSVPVGTELVITAQSDKPLKRVTLKPVTPNVTPDALLVPDTAPFDTFRIRFGADNPIRQVDKSTEFQLVLTDTDDVSSTRTIAIQATDDAPPAVDVVVDPIVRRVNGYYFVTPVARIPFLPESKISDDTGLSDVRFEFRKAEEEARSVVEARAQTAAAFTAAAVWPAPSWALPGVVMGGQKLFELQFGSTVTTDSTGNEQLPGVTHPRYAEQAGRLQRNTLDLVRQRAGQSLPEDGPPAVVKSVKLASPEGDAFDFQQWMPDLLEKTPGAVQPRYKVELFVVARDVNVELTGRDGNPTEPKTSKNLDPIRIQVVSEQDLLAEIAKDEEQQVTRMEDVMKKATDGQVKLSKESALLVNPDAGQIQSSQVRATDIQQDVGKVRDILGTMRAEYDQLYREMDTNRCGLNVMRKYQDPENRRGYLDILKRIFDNSLPQCERSLAAFQEALAAGRRPSDDQMTAARTDFLTLIKDLTELQYEIGVGQDLAKNREILKRIIDAQLVLGKGIQEIEAEAQRRLFRPEVTVAKVVQIPVGQKKAAKVNVTWKLYDKDEVYIAVSVPPEADVKAPPEMTVKAKGGEETTTADLEITAGTKPGLYTLKLLPGPYKPGEPVRPVELTIEVTK